MTDQWLERVNRALRQYDMGLLDVRGVAEVLIPEPTADDEPCAVCGWTGGRGPISDEQRDAVVATMTRLRHMTAWWASPDFADAVLEAARDAEAGQ